MNLFKKAVIVFCIVPWSLCFSQFKWEQTEGPYGGRVYTLFNGDDGKIFAGSRYLFESRDDGVTWEKGFLPDTDIKAFCRDRNSRILASAAHGIYRTDNNGDTWIKICGSNSFDQMVLTEFGYLLAIADNIYESKNDGVTWTRLTNDLPYDHLNSNSIVIDSDDRIFVGTEEQGVLCSTDYGITWETMNNGLPYNYVQSLAVDKKNTLFITAYGAFYRSTNHGKSWKEVVAFYNVLQQVFCPLNSRAFIASTEKGWPTLFISDDNGSNWDEGPSEPDFSDVRCMLETKHGTLLAGFNNFGIYKSNDNGNSFAQCKLNQPLATKICCFAPSTVLVMTATTHLYKTFNGGSTWNDQNFGDLPISVKSTTQKKYLFLTSTNYLSSCPGFSILFSSDGGSSWKDILFYQFDYVYDANANSLGELFHSHSSNKLMHSTDGGSNWTPLDILNPNETYKILGTVRRICIDKYDNMIIGTTSGVFYSSDSGKTWQNISQSASLKYPDILNTNPFNNDLYASFSSGLYKSSDTGNTWMKMSPFSGYINQLDFNSAGHVFVRTGSAIYRSTDQGLSWSTINNGPETISFAIGSDDVLYYATLWDGIFRSQSPTTDVHDRIIDNKTIDHAGENHNMMIYPNPSHELSSLTFTMKENSFIHLSLYNYAGKSVKNIYEGYVESGQNQFTFDSHQLPAGVYFCKLISGKEVVVKRVIVTH